MMSESRFLGVGAGWWLVVAAGALSMIALPVYSTVTYRSMLVYALIGLTVAAVCVCAVLCASRGWRRWMNILPVMTSALVAFSSVWAVSLMVNPLGYVVSGLNPMGTILGFIVFESLCLLSVVLFIVSAFLGCGRTERAAGQERVA